MKFCLQILKNLEDVRKFKHRNTFILITLAPISKKDLNTNCKKNEPRKSGRLLILPHFPILFYNQNSCSFPGIYTEIFQLIS